MLQSTPISQRTHISFFGCVNSGKSSLVNAIVNQELSIVSEIRGTTTDPVKKTMELLPLGPVVIIDTPGFDDDSILGDKRIEKTNQILSKTDIAILVIDILKGLNEKDKELIELFKKNNIPYLKVYNKLDLAKQIENEICVSAKTRKNIEFLKEEIAKYSKKNIQEKFIIKDKIKENDIVILVIPIDESAPKGRIILPQQNTLRELLDIKASVICLQVEQLKYTLENLKTPPKLIITDSQAFNKIKDIVPSDIFLTSFSILFARYKGNLKELIQGVKKIKKLKTNDKILIAEACTHHRQCNDIGSVKIPLWLEKFTGKKFNYSFSSGNDFPKKLDEYSLIIHCGACMLNEKEMNSRIKFIKENNQNIINYGILIAYLNGILDRALEIFPEIK